MLASDVRGASSCQGVEAVASVAVVPEPLRALLERIEHGILDLARGADPREAMHALRSSLSDICALTEADPKTLQAVERVVSAGERLAEIAAPSLRSRASAAARGAATRARKRLAAALVGTRPSRIAVSLGRGW
ncbi:hypothetical protein [Methylobacterium indicum]|uniref:Uncharacterized protein n=1 Tax=Methylobacterium indicum TaxID=1775910 RepID=A0A8H8WPW0_9HYPH|nr:hypothetical protein [Methylobacterium indicum]BCM82144.1 hypothetical protein mvi_06050 [Methylobacterium indicum]